MSILRVNTFSIAYEDKGSGPAIVLLHGYPFNRSMWADQVTALADSHRVIAPDLRGLGESDVAPPSMEGMARDVGELMTSLGVRIAVIAGLSMGGYVALAFHRLFPERVSALVLADTRASADTEEAQQVRAQQADRALREGMAGITEDMVPKLVASATPANNPKVTERLREMMMATKPEGAAAALAAMAQRHDQTPFLSQINVPTLIIVGREDAITPVENSELMHRAIKGSRLEVIEVAGHVSNLEQPQQFNGILVSFLLELNPQI